MQPQSKDSSDPNHNRLPQVKARTSVKITMIGQSKDVSGSEDMGQKKIVVGSVEDMAATAALQWGPKQLPRIVLWTAGVRMARHKICV